MERLAKGYDAAILDAVRLALVEHCNSPRRRTLGARQVVEAMRDEIRDLRKAGYDWTEIATLITNAGVGIRPSTVRAYHQPIKSSKKARSQSKEIARDTPSKIAETSAVQSSQNGQPGATSARFDFSDDGEV